MGRNSKTQFEVIETQQKTIKAQDEMLELNKKAKNPNSDRWQEGPTQGF